MNPSRRQFLKQTSTGVIAGLLPISVVRLASATPAQDFSFAYISDAHLQQIKGNQFVRRWDQSLQRAVAETNLLEPRPDFVIFGGDLAQMGSRAELDHGADILSGLRAKTYMVMGEHDYYLDYGDYWSQLYGAQYYSFNHKGVHFVVVNSVKTCDQWSSRWASPERRMLEMAGHDNACGSPFMLGAQQMQWLRADLARVDRNTPVVVLSHAPLQKIHKRWNFWTEEAGDIQALLQPFARSTVIYGHVHQIQHNRIGNTAHTSMLSTAWPKPSPQTQSKTRGGSHLSLLTVPLGRTGPGDERDSTGWQLMNLHSGRVDLSFNLYSNQRRELAWSGYSGE